MTETEEQPVPTWEEVARTYGRFLYTVAYRLTGNADDARDVVQETLLRVRTGLRTYRPGSMEGWLSRIATNVFLDEMRRRKRRPLELLPEDPDRVIPASESAADALAAASISQDIQAEYERTRAVVLSIVGGQALLDANPVLQQSIRRRNPYVDPLSYFQVALLRRLRALGGPLLLENGATQQAGEQEEAAESIHKC